MLIPASIVQVIRHTYDEYEVVAYNLFGRVIRHRMFGECYPPSKRKAWALEQAKQWGERFYLRVDPRVYR